jgi:hypothetical protein
VRTAGGSAHAYGTTTSAGLSNEDAEAGVRLMALLPRLERMGLRASRHAILNVPFEGEGDGAAPDVTVRPLVHHTVR